MSIWKYPTHYDVLVIGAGHAGCEAAHIAARRGAHTLMLTMNADTIAKMSCNPAIGGIAKGHIVREIDALGGIMGKVIDKTGIQFRMLNATKGPAVWAPRAQADKALYALEMKYTLENAPYLDIKQGTVEEFIIKNDTVLGVITKEGISYHASCVILTSGTFLRGLLHIGEANLTGGRAGDPPAVGLSASLEKQGIILGRLKTGTPPRVNSRSIDFSYCEKQPGDEGVRFSYDNDERPRLQQVPCYITYTTEETKKIIQTNIHRSPMYSGKITGVGPRYCPSIEDKIMRFKDKERHQIFLEPEGLQTNEIYVNGVSSSLPFDVQLQFIQSIPALKQAEIIRPAYAIEYDYVVSGQIDFSLESKTIQNLFFAGQINGTSGYEEAAAQGIIAGINAVQKLHQKSPFILKRSEAYIGVMIDDLVTKGVDEPYRMFTSRAEHRLLLRQDNADLRLREYGYKLGCISDKQYQAVIEKKNAIAKEQDRLNKIFKNIGPKGYSLAQLLARPENTYQSLMSEYKEEMHDYGDDTNFQIELNIKYAGYINRQNLEIDKLTHIENIRIPPYFDYSQIQGLRNEARQKLHQTQPCNLGQASRIPGVSPADISVLMIALSKRRRQDEENSPPSCALHHDKDD